jgi:hypothetical protein
MADGIAPASYTTVCAGVEACVCVKDVQVRSLRRQERRFCAFVKLPGSLKALLLVKKKKLDALHGSGLV